MGRVDIGGLCCSWADAFKNALGGVVQFCQAVCLKDLLRWHVLRCSAILGGSPVSSLTSLSPDSGRWW